MYVDVHGRAVGLAITVVSVNRYPTCMAVVAQRNHTKFTSSCIGGLPVVDVVAGLQPGKRCLQYPVCGGPTHPYLLAIHVFIYGIHLLMIMISNGDMRIACAHNLFVALQTVCTGSQ